MSIWDTLFGNYRKTLWAKVSVKPEQVNLAERLGISLHSYDSFFVATARILDSVATAIGIEPPQIPTKPQHELAAKLSVDIAGDSRRVVWVKIKQSIQLQNYDANWEVIHRLGLDPGDDVVERIQLRSSAIEARVLDRDWTVSSVGWDGQVFFKGCNGRQAPARNLSRFDPKTDTVRRNSRVSQGVIRPQRSSDKGKQDSS